ncbi:MAG: hypothetical protein K2G47_05725 [Muribaculum sp.]|nr:hypothetical protein [Muribaculum sp.]
MKAVELEQIQAQLHKQIRNVVASNSSELDSSPLIFDGVAEINAYCASSPKIMWILKEAYGDGTDWDIWDGFESLEQTLNRPTWQVMMYALYGIRTGRHFSDMPKPTVEMLNMLKAIAYINVNKYAAQSHSSDMQKSFKLWRDIIFRQIESYAPDVIIFGNTFSLFESANEELAVNSKKVGGDIGKTPIYKSGNGILLVDAWHPNNTEMKRAEYVDSIIDGVLNNFQ